MIADIDARWIRWQMVPAGDLDPAVEDPQDQSYEESEGMIQK